MGEQNGNSLNRSDNVLSYADKFTFNKGEGESSNYYTILFYYNGARKYLQLTAAKLTFGDDPCYFEIKKNTTNNNWTFYFKEKRNNWYMGYSSNLFTKATSATYFTLYKPTETSAYPARCVTSKNGYQDINLTGFDYVLPDSFRGVGAVGRYVTSNTQTEPYAMKLDKFDGKEQKIDVDIYMNKFAWDNYFNILHGQTSQDITASTQTLTQDATIQHHGIGLFNSVVMISRSEGFCDFTLTGSVNTEINYGDVQYSIYTSGQTMAAKLYSQLTDTSNSRRYTTFADIKDNVIADGHNLDYYLKRTTTDDGDRISTYKTEKGNLPNGVEDFACIMISTADSAETTNLINQYIRLMTNTTDDYAADSEYYTVDVKTCKLVKDTETGKGEFKLITDSTDE